MSSQGITALMVRVHSARSLLHVRRTSPRFLWRVATRAASSHSAACTRIAPRASSLLDLHSVQRNIGDGSCGVGGSASPLPLPEDIVVWADVTDGDYRNSGARYWLKGYGSLSKWRLSTLVLSTTMWGFAMAPGAMPAVPFIVCSAGTGLTIAAANAFNQIYERENDGRMLRTRQRWLPSGRMSVGHAIAFGTLCGLGGVGSIFAGVGALPSILAGLNLLLYTSVYTPMKQTTPWNTYVGAVVGAIPPLIGWTAGGAAIDSGALVLAGLLGVWQIPHFMALSFALKDDYERGGYRMLINTHPERVPTVVLSYAVLQALVPPAAWAAGLCTPMLMLTSLVPTGVVLDGAIRLYRNADRERARRVFKDSLWTLPVLMLLMFFHRNTDEQWREGEHELRRPEAEQS